MPWDASDGHGFSEGTPWLPIGSSVPDVRAQDEDDASTLALYRLAIWIRKNERSC